MLKIFVSHAWADKIQSQFAEVYSELKGYDVWIDNGELTPGENIRQRLTQEITDSEVVIVLWSENTSQSKDALFEIETASKLKKTIFPCVIDDCSLDNSEHLRGTLFIDLRKKESMDYSVVGWMKLRYFLTDIVIRKYDEKIKHYDEQSKAEASTLIANLKQSQQEQRRRIEMLEHSMYRIDKNATDRNKKNGYIFNMADTIIETCNTPTASGHERQIAQFMEFVKQVFTEYPNDDEASLWRRDVLMLNKLKTLDPAGENEKLWMLREGIARMVEKNAKASSE